MSPLIATDLTTLKTVNKVKGNRNPFRERRSSEKANSKETDQVNFPIIGFE